jgi:hypothetical protein
VLALHRNEEAGAPLVFRGGRYEALEEPAEMPGQAKAGG